MDWRGPIIHAGGGNSALTYLLALFPPDLSPEFLAIALQASMRTVAYAVAGITVAVLIGFPLGVVASGRVFPSSTRFRLPVVAATRLFLGGSRAIHALVWAVLFVSAIGLSPVSPIC